MIDDGSKCMTSSPVPPRKQAPTNPREPLSADREHHLAARIKAGDASAREELVLAHMPLVRRMASAFRGHDRVVDLNDLIQEGNLGLLRAASEFDPESHGTRFVNYAACWIRYRLRRVVAEQSTTIRYPYYLVLLRRRFEKAREELIAANKATDGPAERTEPGFEEVFERMGVEGRELRTLRNIRGELRSRAMGSISDPSHQAALARLIPPQEPIEIAESMQRLHAGLRKLTLIQSWVLRRRFRLDETSARAKPSGRGKVRLAEGVFPTPFHGSNARRTFRELSAEIGMPIHQLRAIERSALSKLEDILEPAAHESERPIPIRHSQIASRRSA